MSGSASQRGLIRSIVNALLAAFMVFGAGAALAPSANAAAQAECWTPSANGEGRGYMKGGFNLKSGPYQSGCNNTGWAPQGSTVYFQCWTTNSHRNDWWYVRLAGTQTYGWTSAANILFDPVDENGDGFIKFSQC
ncbi:hypothetical protein [Streptomyces bottropensis]|uniref:Uncharacterized protein n=1 Tax=Streptomyces bottropensis TaxID=42235 RepID=A0ABU8B0X9_9ACTN|nr:hypothetical protein [Streptomyces bottropensis]